MTRLVRLVAHALTWFACVVAAPHARAEPAGPGPTAAGAPAEAMPAGALPRGGFSAPPPLPPAQLWSPRDGVPANGSLLFGDTGVLPRAVEFSAGGQPVDGTVRLVDGYAIVTPTEVLQPDIAYQLLVTPQQTAPAPAPQPPLSVTFGPEWTPSRPELSISLSIERIESMAPPKCCTGVPGFAVRPATCFSSQRIFQIRVTPALSSTSTPLHLSQYLFRVRALGASSPPPLYRTIDRANNAAHWAVARTEYCIELDALEITSGRAESYDDLPGRCIAHGNLPNLDVVELDPGPMALSSAVCSVPPTGFEQRWCELNGSACEGDPSASGCENFDHLCRGGPVPVPTTPANRAPLVTPPGPKPLAGALAAGSGGADAPRPMRPGAGFGCSAVAVARSSDLAAIAVFALTLILAGRRRRAT